MFCYYSDQVLSYPFSLGNNVPVALLFPLVVPQEASGDVRYGSSLLICKLFCSNFLQTVGFCGQLTVSSDMLLLSLVM